ncbi:MAG: response regulator [Deltaproteobacteria bacterium]|nr:response regulator [Deltaproteobacteria bacterium]
MEKRPDRILIVDDDRSIREALFDYLSEKNYQVETADSGDVALEAIKSKGFDVVLTDLMLPGMDGIEVMRLVREYDQDIAVILMTGFGSIESAMSAIKEGAYDYLAKPFKLDEMLVTVKNACEKVYLKRRNKFYVGQIRHRNGDRDWTEQETAYMPSGDKSTLSDIERLGGLLDRGLITIDEFDILKKRLLAH